MRNNSKEKKSWITIKPETYLFSLVTIAGSRHIGSKAFILDIPAHVYSSELKRSQQNSIAQTWLSLSPSLSPHRVSHWPESTLAATRARGNDCCPVILIDLDPHFASIRLRDSGGVPRTASRRLPPLKRAGVVATTAPANAASFFPNVESSSAMLAGAAIA